MTEHTSPQETPTATAPDRAAVVYLCIRRSAPAGSFDAAAEERAAEEARRYAVRHDLTIIRTITDLYGEIDPMQRPGWPELRQIAEDGEAHTVLTRWTAAVSPVYEHVSAAAKDLSELCLHIVYTWNDSPAPEMK